MQGIKEQVANKKVQPNVKNGVWEVMLTDPRLNKFTFGPSLIGHYVMTDIVSPFGQKSVHYSTISKDENSEIVVELNLNRIDDCNITGIRLVSTSLFFKKWNVHLVDNRTGAIHEFHQSELFDVEPSIVYNKLFGLGFMPEDEDKKECFFELHLKMK